MSAPRPLLPWIVTGLLVLSPGRASAQLGGSPDTTTLFPMGPPSLLWAPANPAAVPLTVKPPQPPTPTDFHPGSRGLAYGETLLGLLIPWVFNEYVSKYKDITRTSPTRWKENISEGLLWDDNHFHVNMLLHPYSGSLSFAAGRSNGYNFERSVFFSAVGSAFWECCGESHRPSPGDFITTTFGGVLLGEILHRWTNQILNHRNGPPPNGWWEVPVAVLSPVRTFSRWALDRFGATAKDFKAPDRWAVHTKTGVGLNPFRVFQEVDYTYGDVVPLTDRSRPFEHFETAVELSKGGGTQIIQRVQARGNLWARRLAFIPTCLVSSGSGGPSSCLVYWGNIVPFLGFDYINNDAYEFGGQSLGLAAFVTIGQYPHGTYGSLALDGHGMFGSVKSEHASRAQQLHDERSERDREYDITGATGWNLSGIVRWGNLHLSGFYRRDRHRVINGSNYKAASSNHLTTLLGGTARYKFWGRLGAGVEYRRYHRTSQFDTSFEPLPINQTDNRFSLFLTLDAVRPLGLFVF